MPRYRPHWTRTMTKEDIAIRAAVANRLGLRRGTALDATRHRLDLGDELQRMTVTDNEVFFDVVNRANFKPITYGLFLNL